MLICLYFYIFFKDEARLLKFQFCCQATKTKSIIRSSVCILFHTQVSFIICSVYKYIDYLHTIISETPRKLKIIVSFYTNETEKQFSPLLACSTNKNKTLQRQTFTYLVVLVCNRTCNSLCFSGCWKQFKVRVIRKYQFIVSLTNNDQDYYQQAK